MQSAELMLICAVAFLMVFVILAFLAVMMRVIMLFFPERKVKTDTALITAIAAAAQTVFPGTQVTHIEEKK